MNTLDEARTFVEPVEVRSAPGGKLVLTGVAIRYAARSQVLAGGFRERVMPGAATEAIQKGDVLAWEEHRSERYLGRTGNGTLRLVDGRDALRYEVDLPDTAVGREVAALAERGDYKGSSFGFIKGVETWSKEPDGTSLRTITALKSLRDVGPTVSPAYVDADELTLLRSQLLADPNTPVEVRSMLARQGRTLPPAAARVVVHRRPTWWFC